MTTGLPSDVALRKAAALILQTARSDDRAARAVLSQCGKYSEMRSLCEAVLVVIAALVGDQREQLAAAAERLIVNLDGDIADDTSAA